jgi:eukaryotic-like serine/threonine-protein kinase
VVQPVCVGVGFSKQLSTAADVAGLKHLSIACSVYLGEALLNNKDYKQARTELERALARAEKLGLRTLQAQIRDLLGSTLAQSGNSGDASYHYAEAQRLLDEIQKEAQSTELLKRANRPQANYRSFISLSFRKLNT